MYQKRDLKQLLSKILKHKSKVHKPYTYSQVLRFAQELFTFYEECEDEEIKQEVLDEIENLINKLD